MNRGVLRPALILTVASLTLGCQVLAGIDDRSVAPVDDAADSSIADTELDTGATIDSSVEDSVLVDTGEDTTVVLSDSAGDASGDVSADTADTSSSGSIVINEVKASGGDYVEIYNRGTATVDISGWGVTGTEDTGAFSTPVRFAAGTTLAPGAWLLILAGMPSRGGPNTSCGLGGPPSCYYTDWGISQSRGETLRVLRADDSIEDEYSYPMNAHPDSMSWGRVPDGTGTFVVNSPTPGAANVKL